jgi:HK97 family phage prohead protease
LPWHIEKGGGTCDAGEWAVIKDSDGSTAGCHGSEDAAKDQLAALYAQEEQMASLKDAGTRRAEHFRGATEATNFPPAGAARLQPFAAELRAKLVEREGQERYQLDGYATVFGRGYEMWDLFGPYREFVDQGAADDTIAANPDVAFLVNHRGVTMARTTAKTLELEVDALGLRSRAFVNPKRQDVRDLIVAVDDRDITEMSFAFLIDEGEWNEEFTEFHIRKFNIHRGDVSAVNYGANPYTSIAARAHEVLADLEHLPIGAARAALTRLARRLDLPDLAAGGPQTPAAPAVEPGGMSLELARELYLDD